MKHYECTRHSQDVFFGSKFLSSPVPSDGTLRRDLESALNGLMPLCRNIPGVRPAPDIRECRMVPAPDRTPRADVNALAGSYHYIVSGKDGVKEVAGSQAFFAGDVLLAGNDRDNLPENMAGLSGRSSASGEKTSD